MPSAKATADNSRKAAAAAEQTKRRRLVGQHLRELQLGRQHYEKADAAVERLLADGMKPGDSVTLRDGATWELVDNFTDPKTGEPKNKAFKPAGMNRFVLRPRKRDQ